MASSAHSSSSTISTEKPAGLTKDNNYYYSDDPEGNNDVNLNDPDELEAHLEIQDVRARLRLRRRRMIRIFTVGFIVLVGALLLGMGLTGKEGKENAQEAKEQQGMEQASTGTDTRLPQPPADLASKCSLTSLNTPQGIAGCEGACEIADCCDVPDGYALSCLAANTVVCAQYQRYCDILHNLPSAGFIPPPQDSSSEVDDPALKVDIDTACVNDSEGGVPSPTCTRLCQSGFCCFEGSNNCNVNCQTYLNCRTAYDTQEGIVSNPATSPVAQPPVAPVALTIIQQIDQSCGDYVEAINPPGENTCESLCALSFCCFNHYCVPPADIDCLDYSGCYILYTDLDTVDDDTANSEANPALADEIHESCFTAGNINDAIANTECATLCAPGACCFEHNLQCTDVDCATYAECNVLYPSFVSVTKQEVTDACNNHRDNGDAPTLCEQVCTLQVMQCCFHENNQEKCNALQAPGTAYCDNYQACDVLGTSGTSLRDSHKNELEVACSDSKTRSHCITLCSAATCCYAGTIEEECANVDVSITCSDYQACDVLYR
jgi:hypothetical protein